MKPFFEERMERMRVLVYDGFAFPEHLHTQLEMMFLFSGSAEMVLDGEPFQMQPGDLALVFPGVAHGYRMSDAAANGLMMILSPEYAGGFHQQLTLSCPESPIIRAAALHPDVERVCRIVAEESMSGNDEAVQRAYLQVILARTLPGLGLRPQPGGAEQELLRRAMAHLSKSFLGPITLSELARALGASKYHLSHLFSSRLRTNFRAYVNALRVERAQQLLRGTNASITEICYECGFESQRTFNRAFQQLTGTTPRLYRARLDG